MNAFDGKHIDTKAFAYRDLLSLDRWDSFTVDTNLTVVGTPTYVGRYRIVGAQCFFQFSLFATTSIASTLGTTYITLPIAAKGLGGVSTMTNSVANTPVNICHVDVENSRVYLPNLGANGNTHLVCGWYEIG